MNQGWCFLFATVHPADRDVLTADIHAPVLACLTEDVGHQFADAPAHMMGQLPFDLDGLRRGVHQPVRRLVEHRPAAKPALWITAAAMMSSSRITLHAEALRSHDAGDLFGRAAFQQGFNLDLIVSQLVQNLRCMLS